MWLKSQFSHFSVCENGRDKNKRTVVRFRSDKGINIFKRHEGCETQLEPAVVRKNARIAKKYTF
jgi:hypothetical protein